MIAHAGEQSQKRKTNMQTKPTEQSKTSLTPIKGVFYDARNQSYNVTLGRTHLASYPERMLDLANAHRLEAEQTPPEGWPALKEKYAALKSARGGRRSPTKNKPANFDIDEIEDAELSKREISREMSVFTGSDDRQRKLEYVVGLQIKQPDTRDINISLLPCMIEQALQADECVSVAEKQLIAARLESDKRWDKVSHALLAIPSAGLRDSLIALLGVNGDDRG